MNTNESINNGGLKRAVRFLTQRDNLHLVIALLLMCAATIKVSAKIVNQGSTYEIMIAIKEIILPAATMLWLMSGLSLLRKRLDEIGK